MQQWVLDRLRSHVDVNSAWGKPILLSLWLPTGEAMMEDLKERSLLLAGCCCLRLTCYMLVSLCKKRACGHLWLTCWVVESDSPTCLQQQMQYSTCHMHKYSSISCKQFMLKRSIVFVFFNSCYCFLVLFLFSSICLLTLRSAFALITPLLPNSFFAKSVAKFIVSFI